jgi:hypothetical protein
MSRKIRRADDGAGKYVCLKNRNPLRETIALPNGKVPITTHKHRVPDEGLDRQTGLEAVHDSDRDDRQHKVPPEAKEQN